MKKLNGKQLEEIKEEPMSDSDIRAYEPNAKIIKYCNLNKYNKMSDILKHDGDGVYILYQDSNNSGHWCLIQRYTDIKGQKWFEFWDSYGMFPDEQLKFVNKNKRENLGIDGKYLTKLLEANQPEFKTVYSYRKYQDMNPDIGTCGRWCVLRRLKLKDGLNLPEFKEFIEEQKKKYNLKHNDDVVAMLININHHLNQ